MNENSKNNEVYLIYWLLISLFLVASIIVIGGLTRLTDSGLSITEWNLISGIFPPATNDDWEKAFNLYKEIPEFKLVNPLMNLQEFKVIYWWEFIHRFLGRMIGLFFLIPLIYFTLKKSLEKKQIISFYLIFLLIVFQGIIGWYMVKSGLNERTDVSHYRLSIHLTLAFILFILIFWNFLKLTYCKKKQFVEKTFPNICLLIFLLLIIFQISIGAFVSGMDAGQIYNSWPYMNDSFFPDDSTFKDFFSFSLFDTPSLVQFLHRIIAYLIFFYFLIILYFIFRDKKLFYLRKNIIWVFLALFLQILLGIFTILNATQIYIASMHQFGSIILISATIILVYKNSKFSSQP